MAEEDSRYLPRFLADQQSGVSAKERRWSLAAIWLASLAVLWGPAIADPDLWGHTLYGLRSIEQGVWLEKTDPYSYTAAGAAWVNHEWLTEYIFGWLWRTSGSLGLILWRNFWGLALLLIGLGSFLRGKASVAAALMSIGLNVECLSNFFVFIRPQLVTLVLFAAYLTVLRSYWDGRSRKVVWLLPLIMIFWVNSHGGFLAGMAIESLFLLAFGLRSVYHAEYRQPACLLACVVALSLLATLLNPYGAGLYEMLSVHLLPKQIVREWQPLWSVRQSLGYYVPFILIAASLARKSRWDWIDIVVLAAVGYQAVSHLRHLGLLCVTVMVILPGPLAESLSVMFSRISRAWAQPNRKLLRTAALGGVLCFLTGLPMEATLRLWLKGIAPWHIAVEVQADTPGVPMRAVNFLEKHGLDGNILTSYGWAQYVLWHRFPGSRIAFDGRYRTVYGPNLEQSLMEFREVDRAAHSTIELLDEYPTQIILIPCNHNGNRLMESRANWRCVFRDDQASLYVVEDLTNGFLANSVLSQAQAVVDETRWQRFPAGPRDRRD